MKCLLREKTVAKDGEVGGFAFSPQVENTEKQLAACISTITGRN